MELPLPLSLLSVTLQGYRGLPGIPGHEGDKGPLVSLSVRATGVYIAYTLAGFCWNRW